MRKRTFFSLGMLVLTFLLSMDIHAQDPPKPVYIIMTTLHRNYDTDSKDWKATEQEYFDKVTNSDEIYSSIESIGMKEFKATSKEPMIVYIRKSQMSFKNKDKGKNLKEYNEKVTFKDPYIQGYYPFRHAWGADSRDFMEAVYYNSFTDIERSNQKHDELEKAAWPKEADSKAFFDQLKIGFTGVHGDFIYHNLPEASK
jgi:hypothetical protein